MNAYPKRLISIVLASVGTLPFVNAIIIPGIVENTMRDVFMTIPEEWVFRFAYFVITFAILYWVSKKFVFKDKSNIAGVISFVIALTSSLLLGSAFVAAIFRTYGMLLALILLFGPIFGFLYFARSDVFKENGQFTRFGRGFRAIIFGVASYFFGMIPEILSPYDINFLGISPEILSISDIFYVASFVFFILAIINLVLALIGGAGTVADAGWPWNRDSNKKPGRDRSAGKDGDDDGSGRDGRDRDGGGGQGGGTGDDPTDTFDPNSPGQIRVHVVDMDGNPLKGAEITIVPYKRRALGMLRHKNFRKYVGRTDADGFWPSYDTYKDIASGSLTVKVKYRGFRPKGGVFHATSKGGMKTYRQKDCFEIGAGEKRIIRFTMERDGKPDTWFEPFIKQIRQTKDNQGRDALEYTWIIE